MNKNTKDNVWKKNNIPVLEYCTLPRAAEILSCEVADLIKFAETGAIELSLKLKRFEACLTFPLAWGLTPSKWEERFEIAQFPYAHKSALSLLLPKAEFELQNGAAEPVYHYEVHSLLKKPILFLYGLWSLVIREPDASFFSDLSNGLEASLTTLNFTLKECDIPFNGEGNDPVIVVSPPAQHLHHNDLINKTPNSPIATLTVNDIYLTRTQIEKIANGVGGELPNYLNGGVVRPAIDTKEEAREKLTLDESLLVMGAMLNTLKKAQSASKRWTQDSLKAEILDKDKRVNARLLDDYFSSANKIFKSDS